MNGTRGKAFSFTEIALSRALRVGRRPALSGHIRSFSLPREESPCEARAEDEVTETGRDEIREDFMI